jgi:glutamate/tyrosine decarboxylase-like PLP-dependent enzyme
MATMSMHEPTPADAAAAQKVLAWSLARLADREVVLPPAAPAMLPELNEQGIGVEAAIELLLGAVLPTAVPPDHPRYLAFIPGAPTVAAAIADMALAAAMVRGSSRLEAGLAADAEDAVIRWLADVVGFPDSAGGTFVSGGSIATLSALVAARGRREVSHEQVIVAGASAHSSVVAAARIMGCAYLTAPPADAYGRLTPDTLAVALDGRDPGDVVAVVATAGATNNGAVDDLAGLADLCNGRGIWLHVDGAYGGAALLTPQARHLFAGIERADSFIVDPHKWLYAPFDCAAVLYRDAAAARGAHTQEADYLDWLCGAADDNPSDLAVHLARRIRAVPLWVSLQAYGREAYAQAVDRCFAIAAYTAEQVTLHPQLELVLDPALTVLLVRRRGWGPADYGAWSTQALQRGLAFAIPTKHDGETVLRLCFVNPLTSRDDVDLVLDDLG